MSIVYIGIGSNIGNREENFSRAIKRLENTEGVTIKNSSSFYITKPVGGPPQEDYLNGVLELETDIKPEELLKILKQIEKKMGRARAERNFPRIIDLDILLYDNICLNTEKFVIPHPRMLEREFVLRGMKEIAPDVVHPVAAKTIEEIVARRSQHVARKAKRASLRGAGS